MAAADAITSLANRHIVFSFAEASPVLYPSRGNWKQISARAWRLGSESCLNA
jgi:hypothetical protein